MTKKKQSICSCAGRCEVHAAEGCTHGVDHSMNADCGQDCGVNCGCEDDCECVPVRVPKSEQRTEGRNLYLTASNRNEDVEDAFSGLILTPRALRELVLVVRHYVVDTRTPRGVFLDGRRIHLAFDFVRISSEIRFLWEPREESEFETGMACVYDNMRHPGLYVVNKMPARDYHEMPYCSWFEIHSLIGEPGIRWVCRRKHDGNALECRTHIIPLSVLVQEMENANG